MTKPSAERRTFSVRRLLEHGAPHVQAGLTLSEARALARDLAGSGPGMVGIMDDSTNETIEEYERGAVRTPDEDG